PVLLPTDSSACVLELAYLLDQYWAFHQLSYPLILLTHQSYCTIQYTKSMLELRYKDFAKHTRPKVVLASNVSLETGFSCEFLFEISKSHINTLILTDHGPPNSLARTLYYEWDCNSQLSQINKKVPLEGVELLEYKAMQCKKQEREAAQPALVAKSLSIIEEDEADDEKSEAGDAVMEELLAKQFGLYVHDVIKYGGFFKQMQSYLMYPYIEKRKIYDGYGEIIPLDMFKRIDGLIGNDGIGVEPIGDREDMGGGDRGDSNHSSLDSNVPTKYVSYNEDVTFKCQIQFIYLEGTNDRRSLKTIVPQVQPRKLVIKYCAIPIEENTSNNNPIFVGEVKLSELKCLLQSEGITAEFKGEGVLVCNEKVTIKKQFWHLM
ncbi:17428_t:CDS:2, partial [Entrophospora sp. SA101]